MTQEPAHTRGLRRHRIGADDPAADGQNARARIQEVALDLFIDEGYDKTSLREIAERLGVTKAALYYHFPTKEDIVSSMVEDRMAGLKEVIDWAKEQPRTEETRREVIRRYAGLLQGGGHFKIMQFFERNQTLVKTLQSGDAMRSQMMELTNLLSDTSDPPAVQLRRSMAIFAIHASWFVFSLRNVPEEQAREAGLEVAFELISDR
jgi:AcrR family transcriptional regulator